MNQKLLQDYFTLVKSSTLFASKYAGIDSYKDSPILTKPELIKLLKTRFEIQNEQTGVYLVRSGGSTQKPLVFPVDIKENLEQRRLLADNLISDGIFGSRTIAMNLFSYRDMYRTAAIFDDILEKCNATTLALSSNTTNENSFATAQNFKPNMIMGTPSKLSMFARYLMDNNRTLEIDNLLFAGEFLIPSYQKTFTTVFGIKNIYSVYGAAETGIWGWSKYSQNPGLFRILDDIFVEIIDEDEDGYGNIVTTNLLRKRFPLFRYNTGDIGKLSVRNSVPFLHLKSRERKSFSLSANNHFVDDFDEVFNEADKFQIQLSANDSLQTIVKFLVVKNDIRTDEKSVYIDNAIKEIKKLIEYDSNLMSIEVSLVNEDKLFSNVTTSKTPILVDFRT